MEWVSWPLNLYHEVTIDKTTTWTKHANSDGLEHKIASAEVRGTN